MARTPTVTIPLGFRAPDFRLLEPMTGKMISLNDVSGRSGTVVLFICNHCPFVVHVRGELIRVANDFRSQGIGFVAISANDVASYPDDSPELMAELAKSFPFRYLFDETQEVAKAYTASCTPDINVFNAQMHCVYRGQLDGSRPGNSIPCDGRDLRAALSALVAERPVPTDQVPSIGCNIKWKPGNEPDYFFR
jgi:peroxiredoxin